MISLKTNKWQINNIDTVLFDKDGTFIDLHYFWGKMTEMRVSEIIKTFGMPNSSFARLCLYLGYNIETSKMLKDGITAMYSRPIVIEKFNEKLKDENIITTDKKIEEIFDYVSSEFYKDISKYTRPIEPAIDFIKKIKARGIKIGIVTSDAKESTLLTIKNFKWDNLFDVVIGRESSESTKESGIPTKMALEILSANPKTSIMIGDAPMDYISAKNAGIEKTILVATGQIDEAELKKTSDYTIESLNDVDIF